jgi:type IV pilus assembly protein PilW
MRTHIRQAGMSMVELMVAMAIALIGTIIIFQVFEVSEGIRRTTTSGGDAQQNGAIGLYVIENDLRNAGMGFNDTPYAGCDATAFDSTRAPTNFTLKMAPASITGGGANTAPDALSIFYGSQYLVANSTTITAAMTLATSNVKVVPSGRYGFRTGDLLLLFEPGAAVCELMEVTALVGSDELSHDNTAYTLNWVQPASVGTTSRYNPAGGSHKFAGVGAAASRVFNLGNPYDANGTYNLNGPTTPVYNTYAVTANTLTVASKFSSAAAVPIADNIVHMRALYGLDDGVNNNTVTINAFYTAGDGIVDRYVDAATFDAMATKPWQYLAMIRVVLVARSAIAEKPSGGGVCDTTTAAPTWSGSNLGGAPFNMQTSLDLSADPNWQCYRYKVFETAIPLRNWIWKSS